MTGYCRHCNTSSSNSEPLEVVPAVAVPWTKRSFLVRRKRDETFPQIRRVWLVGLGISSVLVAALSNLQHAFLPDQQAKQQSNHRTLVMPLPLVGSLNASALDNRSTGENKRIPTVLLAGVQKASTSSLAVYLMNKNCTCFSDEDEGEKGGHGKEAHFFDAKYERGLDYYQYLFRKCPDYAMLIDGTPETMMHPQRVKAIYDEQGTADEVKIIFILREPISRSISWYNHQLRYAERTDRPAWTDIIFDKSGRIMSYIEVQQATVVKNFEFEQWERLYGYYAYWLRQWSRLFDRRSQILVLSYDELVRDPVSLLHRVHEFLNVTAIPPLELSRENSNTQNTPPPPCDDQLEMAEYFVDLNQELYAFLDDNPGPAMEQRPFPKFTTDCKPTPRIPLVLFAGAPMSGLSSLANHLWYRDDTCFSVEQSYDGSVETAHFFDAPNQTYQEWYGAGVLLTRYQQMFEHCNDDPDAWLVDVSPGSMAHPETVKRIYDEHGVSDQLQIIFVLREPVSRQVASYTANSLVNQRRAQPVAEAPSNTSSTTSLMADFVAGGSGAALGNYVHWLRLWCHYFDREQILVLSYDELIQEPHNLLERVHEFLDTPFDTSDDLNLLNENEERLLALESSMPSCAEQLELATYYEESNAELYTFLDDHPGPSAEERPFRRFGLDCDKIAWNATLKAS